MSSFNWRFRRTTILSAGFISFLIGLGLSRAGQNINIWLIIPVVLFVIVAWRKQNIVTILLFVLAGVLMGVTRGNNFLEKLVPYETLYGQEVTLRAVATSDGVYADNGQLDFDASSVKIINPVVLDLPGEIKVQALGVPAVYRGDVLELEGKIYPYGGARQGRISYANVKVLGRSGLFIEKTRREFVAGMQTALPEPQASFGLGLLVGQRNTLPDSVSEQLSIVGLTHIIAVSGYNLTIIVRGARRLLGKRSKYQSIMVSLILVGCFMFFTGFSASIVRAAIVSVLSLAAWYYGRAFKPILLISMAAAITAGWNPIYLWSDIGWYLSFLAFFGVLVIAPAIKTKLLGKKKQKFMGQVMIESISAQIMAAPLILYIFNEASLVALLSNAIIVPLVPFAMIFSLLAGISGMFIPLVAGLFALPATLLMTYMLDIVNLFSRFPHAHIKVAISLAGTLAIYGLIIFVTVVTSRKVRARYGTITDKNIIE